ncbi:SDR family oxidoreductase [Nocardia sp. NPDC088792]|uniref:SDR family oxidoreductase n=1 Tax=Nocardia sp. NPDC088792 TaxID=3364332 RepID=UPI0038127926
MDDLQFQIVEYLGSRHFSPVFVECRRLSRVFWALSCPEPSIDLIHGFDECPRGTTMTTLVIGARGSIGREVLNRLLAAGEPVRASARNPAAAGLPDGVAVVAADLTEPETLSAALDGVTRVFLYAPTGGAAGFITAARDADVQRIVLMSSGSVLLPDAVGNTIAEERRRVEQALTDSGLPWTPVRPLVLANNALHWAESIRTEGVVRLVDPEAMTAPIHERDIAAVAVAALTDSAGAASDAMLTGPELVSQQRQVELIATAIGADIRIEKLSKAQARERFGRFERPEIVEAILDFINAAAHGGSPMTDTVQRVLARPATSFAQWAHEHAADFR